MREKSSAFLESWPCWVRICSTWQTTRTQEICIYWDEGYLHTYSQDQEQGEDNWGFRSEPEVRSIRVSSQVSHDSTSSVRRQNPTRSHGGRKRQRRSARHVIAQWYVWSASCVEGGSLGDIWGSMVPGYEYYLQCRMTNRSLDGDQFQWALALMK